MPLSVMGVAMAHLSEARRHPSGGVLLRMSSNMTWARRGVKDIEVDVRHNEESWVWRVSFALTMLRAS